jgi:hypothetical protein
VSRPSHTARTIVGSTHGAQGLDATIVEGGVGRIGTARADAQRADAIAIDIGERGQIVDRGADILDPCIGVFELPRLAAALALIRSVEGERDEAELGELAGIQAGGLLLHATGGVGAHDRRYFLPSFKPSGGYRSPTILMVPF